MNYSPPRGDKTRPREEAQPCKQVPGAEICLLMTSLGWGWACRAAVRGASALGAREKLGLIRGRSRRPARAICQTPGLGAITGGPAGLAARACEGWPVCVCVCVRAYLCVCALARVHACAGCLGVQVCVSVSALCIVCVGVHVLGVCD